MATERKKTEVEIDELRSRYDKLKEKRLLAQNNLENANKQLETLRQQARDQWGTDDLQQLRERLEQMKKENEERVAAYREHLDSVERQLREVEQKHSGEGTP